MHRKLPKTQKNTEQIKESDENSSKSPVLPATTEMGINYFADEDSIYYDISPHHMETAIKSAASFVVSCKHEIVEGVAAGLHALADAMNSIHLAGQHLKGALKYAGPISEIVSEIIHNPSSELMEKLVCGTTVGFVKEAVNISIAVEVGASIGLMSSVITTPAGGFLATGATAVAAYKMVNKITNPLGHFFEHKCHMMLFSHARANQVDPGIERLQNGLEKLWQNKLSDKYVPESVSNHIAKHFGQSQNVATNSVTSIIANGPSNYLPNSGTESLQACLAKLKSNPSADNIPASVSNHIANHFADQSQNQNGAQNSATDRVTSIIAEGLRDHANKQTQSSTKSLMDNLNALQDSRNSSSYNMTNFAVSDFSPVRESKPDVNYFGSLAEAQRHATFWHGYLSGDCSYTPPVNPFSGTGGPNGYESGKSGSVYCDPRTGDCRGSGSSTCKSSFGK